jgi:diketogulonate reductase-like aldo/keto reductase
MSTKGSFKLNNGVTIPGVGFGTWKSSPEDAYNSVKTALAVGYRHIDTAWVNKTYTYTRFNSADTEGRSMGMNQM